MRVILVTPSYFPIVGGSEMLTQTIAIKLNEHRVNADIMAFNMNEKWSSKWREEITADGPTTVFKEGALNPFLGLPNPMSNVLQVNVIPNPNFVRKLREYDIIHFIGEADLSLPLFSYFVKKPKILHCVGIFRRGGIFKYYTSERVFLGKIFKKVFPHLASCFVVSSQDEKELLQSLGVAAEKIAVLQPAVDTKIFWPDPSKKTENLVLFVGRIDRIKGLHRLLQALEFIETPLNVVAIGPPWDREYSKEIEDMSYAINESGHHSVNLIGTMDAKDLVPWYQKASVLVCPYMYETHSSVVREALACGTPVVSTGSHLVENCSDGILLAQRNPRKLAGVISSLLASPETCEKLGKRGRSVIEKSFSWDAAIKDLIGLYKEVLCSF